jgi:hypothetical protein
MLKRDEQQDLSAVKPQLSVELAWRINIGSDINNVPLCVRQAE